MTRLHCRSRPPYGVVLPRLVNDETAYTVFTVQNTGNIAGAATVRLYNLTGSLVYEDTVTLAPLGWKAYDQSQIPELSAGFEGSGEVASAEPLIGIVDELERPIVPATPVLTSIDPTSVVAGSSSFDAGRDRRRLRPGVNRPVG